MDDEKAKKIAEILGNKSCKKILDFLSETKKASEKEISNSINSPINTVEYNLKKLLEAGLIEKSKEHFWSKKGKKIPVYELSNKSIIISPKNSNISKKLKTLFSVIGISAIATIGVKYFSQLYIASETSQALTQTSDKFLEVKSTAIQESINLATTNIWIWFLIGALFAGIIYTILSWRKSQ